ncbi:MAG: hypothetical protein JSS49_01300 [Planctomycetes bacterium]|nr:hypothetical protein [Planctomycetota bacterium]
MPEWAKEEGTNRKPGHFDVQFLPTDISATNVAQPSQNLDAVRRDACRQSATASQVSLVIFLQSQPALARCIICNQPKRKKPHKRKLIRTYGRRDGMGKWNACHRN